MWSQLNDIVKLPATDEELVFQEREKRKGMEISVWFFRNYIKTSKSVYFSMILLKNLTTYSLMISLKQHGNVLPASSDLQIKLENCILNETDTM